jgi:hypothetical protein
LDRGGVETHGKEWNLSVCGTRCDGAMLFAREGHSGGVIGSDGERVISWKTSKSERSG